MPIKRYTGEYNTENNILLMGIETIKLLDKYDKNIKILDISNKKIKGTLCLYGFINLEKLICSCNQITEMINLCYDIKYIDCSNNNIENFLNLEEIFSLEELYCQNNKINEIKLPSEIKYLNCSNNKITKLMNIPDDLIGINCKSNPLTDLYYPFNVKPKKWPSKLTHLILGNNFNQSLDNLPKTLEKLEIGNELSKNYFVINNLPETIIELTLNFKYDFNFENALYEFSKKLKTLNIKILNDNFSIKKNMLFNLIKNYNELTVTSINFELIDNFSVLNNNEDDNLAPDYVNLDKKFILPDYINFLNISGNIKYNIPLNINALMINNFDGSEINKTFYELNKNLFVIKNKKDIIVKNYSKNNIYFIEEIKENYFVIKCDSNLIVGFVNVNIFLKKSLINKIELSSLDLIENIKELKNYETYFTNFCSDINDFSFSKEFEKIDNLIINFDRNFNQKIDNLPINTKKINFNGYIWDDDWYPNGFNQSFNKLPNKITHIEIKLNMFFNQSLDYLPSSIKYLHIESDAFNKNINNLPNELEYLHIGWGHDFGSFNHSLDNLPDSINHLELFLDEANFKQKIKKLPKSLKILKCNNFVKNIIPDKYKKFIIDDDK